MAADWQTGTGKTKQPKNLSNKKKKTSLEWSSSPKKAPHNNIDNMNGSRGGTGSKSDNKKKKASSKATEKKKVSILNSVSKYKMSKKIDTKKEAKKKANEIAKKNKSNSGKQQQQTQLPTKRNGQGRIPWMVNSNGTYENPVTIDLTASDDLTVGTRYDEACNRQNKRFRLPTDDIDPALLARFSEELRAFSEYIRLTPAECEARNAVLEQMHNVAIRVFQNSPEINVNDLELQVFGSYACRDVSTFRSDVDVALWGAVFPKLAFQRRIAKVSSSDTKKEARTEVDPKTKKVQKWLALLDESNSMTPDHHPEEEQKPKTGMEESNIQPKTRDATHGDEEDGKQRGDCPKDPTAEETAGDDDMPLFVLDRTGVKVSEEQPLQHDDTTKSQAPASVSTQATVAESESSIEGDTKKCDKGEENDSSDDDTADKLTESREASVSRASSQADLTEVTRGPSVASSNPSDGSEVENDDDDMSVFFYNKVAPVANNNNTEAADFSRRKVIDGLQRFFRGLRNSGLTKSIQLISRA